MSSMYEHSIKLIDLEEMSCRNKVWGNLARELSVGSSAGREIIIGLSMSLLIEPRSRENALWRRKTGPNCHFKGKHQIADPDIKRKKSFRYN